jgi:hypothetical protein
MPAGIQFQLNELLDDGSSAGEDDPRLDSGPMIASNGPPDPEAELDRELEFTVETRVFNNMSVASADPRGMATRNCSRRQDEVFGLSVADAQMTAFLQRNTCAVGSGHRQQCCWCSVHARRRANGKLPPYVVGPCCSTENPGGGGYHPLPQQQLTPHRASSQSCHVHYRKSKRVSSSGQQPKASPGNVCAAFLVLSKRS